MKPKLDSEDRRPGRSTETHQWAASAEGLAMREVYPPEEFAGFENFGEFPEWHPGQATADLAAQNAENPSGMSSEAV